MFKIWYLTRLNDGSSIESVEFIARSFAESIQIFTEETNWTENHIVKIIRLE